jgi:hypothetical protein
MLRVKNKLYVNLLNLPIISIFMKNILSLFLKKKGYNITKAEKRKYLLPKHADLEILTKCKQLKKKNLNKDEKLLVKLIKSQLEKDWRKPLILKLNQLLKKHR